MPQEWKEPVEHPSGSLDRAVELAKQHIRRSERLQKLKSGAVTLLRTTAIYVPVAEPIITKILNAMAEQNKDEGTLAWIKRRLKEASTWAGIVMVLGVLGFQVSPDIVEQAAHAVVAIIGLFLIIRRERKIKEEYLEEG